MGFSRQYPFNNGDLAVCAEVLQNYLEANPANAPPPFADVRYLVGEIMYGGHITGSARWPYVCFVLRALEPVL